MADRETIIERVKAKLQREPNAPNKKIFKDVKGSNLDIVTQVRKMVGKLPAKEVSAPVKGKTFDHFKKQYDVREKIKDGLKRLGNDCYMTDSEFRDFCGVHINFWRRFAEDDQFKSYRLRVGGIWHWAGAGMIKRMKDAAGIIY